jgi:polyhydroxybutyrate depolymerase
LSIFVAIGCAHRATKSGNGASGPTERKWKEKRRKEWIAELGENAELRKIEFQNRTREYLLYTPKSLDANTPAPMVIGFHGGTTSDVRFARTTLFHRLADEKGFLVAYPNGVGGNWNDGRGTANPEIDDVGFVMALIDEVKARHKVDVKRIYATGISNGAFMVQRLACEKSERFAAFSAVAGSMGTALREACNPRSPAPMLIMNSPYDKIVPWEGGEMERGKGGSILSIPSLVEFWKSKSSCGSMTEEVLQKDGVPAAKRVKIQRFDDCRNRASVTLYRVEDGGHTWPDGIDQPAIMVGPTSKQFNATLVSWEFFRGHVRP